MATERANGWQKRPLPIVSKSYVVLQAKSGPTADKQRSGMLAGIADLPKHVVLTSNGGETAHGMPTGTSAQHCDSAGLRAHATSKHAHNPKRPATGCNHTSPVHNKPRRAKSTSKTPSWTETETRVPPVWASSRALNGCHALRCTWHLCGRGSGNAGHGLGNQKTVKQHRH